jgi:NTP pyrophosphatase (non-canonical NTP hydrolase)
MGPGDIIEYTYVRARAQGDFPARDTRLYIRERSAVEIEAVGLNRKMMEVRQMADVKGFSAGEERIWEMLALIHTEISEATDAYKKGEPLEEVGEELIDALIRILHLLSALGMDAERIYQHKMEQNRARPFRYGTVRGG